MKVNHNGILEHINRRENNWILASLGRHAGTKKPDTRIQQPIPTSVNRYNVLQTLNEPLPKAPIPKYEHSDP